MLLRCKLLTMSVKQNISIIVAVDKRMAIGQGGDQLVYISADLKHFKTTTTGHTIVMGRKTSNALPKGALPNRRNIVVTRSADWQHEGVEVAHSPEEAIAMCADDAQVFVIGGGELYNIMMPHASKLYVTHIDHAFAQADTFFPEIDHEKWQMTEKSEIFHDEKSGLDFYFSVYELR